jgi:hypothetical protein
VPVASPTRTELGAVGGLAAFELVGARVEVPSGAVESLPVTIDLTTLAVDTLPPPPAGFLAGERAFQLSMSRAPGLAHCREPLLLSYHPSLVELSRADNDLGRLRPGLWTGADWAPLACVASATPGDLDCTTPLLGTFTVLIAPPAAEPLDFEITGGHFYTQANGFSGAGGLGYAVLDDDVAAFWTEYQRLGGPERLGFPISHRFQHQGFLTQAFQKAGLQWRPELGRATPVNVLDDLSQAGADDWLDRVQHIPPALDTSADAGLSFEQVLARHQALLDPYPSLQSFYQDTPDALDRLGLPLAVKTYAPLVSVRLQRGSLQLWTADVPWAAAGSVEVGNSGDLAKLFGLWPLEATPPRPPASAPADSSSE